MKESSNVKIWLTLPKDSLEIILNTIAESGAGIIGNYSHCSFVSEGMGYFKPMEGSNPTIGKIGDIHSEPEYALQFVCPKNLVKQVIENIKAVHPYEEVAFDIYPLYEI